MDNDALKKRFDQNEIDAKALMVAVAVELLKQLKPLRAADNDAHKMMRRRLDEDTVQITTLVPCRAMPTVFQTITIAAMPPYRENKRLFSAAGARITLSCGDKMIKRLMVYSLGSPRLAVIAKQLNKQAALLRLTRG